MTLHTFLRRSSLDEEDRTRRDEEPARGDKHNLYPSTPTHYHNWSSIYASADLHINRSSRAEVVLDDLVFEASLVYDALLILLETVRSLDAAEWITGQHPAVSCSPEQPWSKGATFFNYLNTARIDGLTGQLILKAREREKKPELLSFSTSLSDDFACCGMVEHDSALWLGKLKPRPGLGRRRSWSGRLGNEQKQFAFGKTTLLRFPPFCVWWPRDEAEDQSESTKALALRTGWTRRMDEDLIFSST